MIAIVDYGVGNLRSVERALLAAGANPKLTSDQDELGRADGLVLPGVGAFAPALEKLHIGGLGRRVVDEAKRGKPILGVCLGYQLLFDRSEEHGDHEGLGLLSGTVTRVKATDKLPVIGWCKVRQEDDSPLWAGIEDRSYFYFVHSYTPVSRQGVIGSTDFAQAAAAARANVMGTQFHPEKSGSDGLRIYANFLSICGSG
ncbi:MAG TPA: imidazole glycerol phosphate synthase subunit HisH [Candidatus Dormibacteraeota bacterium]|jgi:glutamine amidotransferase|nr:imidazole glycerol phosphate synthase subunit HisH [Candidatus Dormibacteraeota bacterium]